MRERGEREREGEGRGEDRIGESVLGVMGVHTTITSQFRATFSSSKLNEPHKPSVNLDSSHTGQPPGQVRW